MDSKLTCDKCGDDNIKIITGEHIYEKPRSVGFWIAVVLLFPLGLLLLLANRETIKETKVYGVCEKCGNKFEINRLNEV